jgi:hypothetical protein
MKKKLGMGIGAALTLMMATVGMASADRYDRHALSIGVAGTAEAHTTRQQLFAALLSKEGIHCEFRSPLRADALYAASRYLVKYSDGVWTVNGPGEGLRKDRRTTHYDALPPDGDNPIILHGFRIWLHPDGTMDRFLTRSNPQLVGQETLLITGRCDLARW